MSLGAGIFLSVLVVCVLVLFLQTKDRWRWGRILLWSVGLLVGLIVLAGGGIWGYWTYQDRPVVQTEYLDVPLGATKEEVLYRLGPPAEVYREPTEGEKNDLPPGEGWVILANKDGIYAPGKSAKDYDFWTWEPSTGTASTVKFTDNKVVSINCNAPEGKYCTPMLGIGTGFSEQLVRSVLGEPTKSELSSNSKNLEYHQLNVTFGFTKQKLNSFTVQKMDEDQ